MAQVVEQNQGKNDFLAGEEQPQVQLHSMPIMLVTLLVLGLLQAGTQAVNAAVYIVCKASQKKSWFIFGLLLGLVVMASASPNVAGSNGHSLNSDLLLSLTTDIRVHKRGARRTWRPELAETAHAAATTTSKMHTNVPLPVPVHSMAVAQWRRLTEVSDWAGVVEACGTSGTIALSDSFTMGTTGSWEVCDFSGKAPLRSLYAKARL